MTACAWLFRLTKSACGRTAVLFAVGVVDTVFLFKKSVCGVGMTLVPPTAVRVLLLFMTLLPLAELE